MTVVLLRVSKCSHQENFELASIFFLITFILENAERIPSFFEIVKAPTFAEDAKLGVLSSDQQFDVATRSERCYHLITEYFEGFAGE